MPEPILMPNGITVIGKPFPRICAKCRTKSVWPVTIAYRSTIRFEGQLQTVDTPQLVIPQCKDCGELYFDNYADDQINLAFRIQLHFLSGEQIRANRKVLGLSVPELAGRLGIDDNLLQKWEDDLAIQPRAMDKLMRLYFALPQVRSALDSSTPHLDLGTVVVQ